MHLCDYRETFWSANSACFWSLMKFLWYYMYMILCTLVTYWIKCQDIILKRTTISRLRSFLNADERWTIEELYEQLYNLHGRQRAPANLFCKDKYDSKSGLASPNHITYLLGLVLSCIEADFWQEYLQHLHLRHTLAPLQTNNCMILHCFAKTNWWNFRILQNVAEFSREYKKSLKKNYLKG